MVSQQSEAVIRGGALSPRIGASGRISTTCHFNFALLGEPCLCQEEWRIGCLRLESMEIQGGKELRGVLTCSYEVCGHGLRTTTCRYVVLHTQFMQQRPMEAVCSLLLAAWVYRPVLKNSGCLSSAIT
jgi:hypothetical protein